MSDMGRCLGFEVAIKTPVGLAGPAGVAYVRDPNSGLRETGWIRPHSGKTGHYHDGDYALLDADFGTVRAIDGYVPDIMCPGGEADGDYVIMAVGPDGVIANWRVDLADFEKEDR